MMDIIRKFLLFDKIYKIIIGSIIYFGILWTIIYQYSKYLENQQRENIILQTKLLAHNIDIMSLQQFKLNDSDKYQGYYYKIKNQLRDLFNLDDKYSSLYIIAKNKKGKILFLADNALIGLPSEIPSGTIYENPPQEVKDLFVNKRGYCIGPYKEDYDEWVSGFYPIFDKNDELIAYLGVDISPKDWYASIRKMIVPPFNSSLLLYFVLLLLVFIRRKRLKSIASITNLDSFLNSDIFLVCKTDLRGKITYTNSNFLNIFKWIYHSEYLEGKDFYKITFENYKKDLLSFLQKVIKTPGTSFQMTLKNPSQTYDNTNTHWMVASITNTFNKPDELIFIGIENSQVQSFLKEFDQDRDIFSSGPVMTVIINNDKDWQIKNVSNNIQEVLGYSKEEFLRIKYINLFEESDKARIINELKFYKNNDINNFELSFRIRNKDGIYKWFYGFTRIEINEEKQITEFKGYIFEQTQIKEKEELLSSQKDFLQEILECTNAGTWDWNLETNEFEINERWAQIIGYTKQELTPSDINIWFQNMLEEDLATTLSYLNKHFEKELDYFDVEYRLKHKNGSIRWINSRGQVVQWDKNRKPIRMRGTNLDVTARLEAIQLVKDNENLLTSLLKSVAGMVFLIDKDFTIQLAEGLDLKKLGFTSSFLVGKKVNDFYGEDTDILKIIERGLNGEYHINYSEFNDEVLENHISPVFNSLNEITGIVCISTNITERKKSEDEIKKLSTTVEQSPNSISITNVYGLIEYINPKFTENTGYSLPEKLNKKPNYLNPKIVTPEIVSQIMTNLLSGKDWVGEIKNIRKNGDVYWENLQVAPIKDENNNILNFVAIAEDITDKKNLLNELIKAKSKVEDSDKLKTAFLQNISHEIRTPLNGIIGFSKLLESEDLTKEEINEFVKLITLSSNRFLETISNILELSQIETNQINIKNSFLSVNELLIELHDIHQDKIIKKDIDFKISTPLDDYNSIIYSDKEKLSQILKNLLSNALKFTHSGEITLGYEYNNIDFIFFVKDTGVGIAKELHDKIFDRFYQVEYSISRSYEGTGLGLTICKELVKLLNGNIWVESQPGIGSIFYFSIPSKNFNIDDIE